MNSNNLSRRFEDFINGTEAHLPGIIEPSYDRSGDDDEDLNITVMDPDEFGRILKEVSGEKGFRSQQTESPALNDKDISDPPLALDYGAFIPPENDFPECEDSNQTFKDGPWAEIDKNDFSSEEKKEIHADYYTQAFTSQEEHRMSPTSSPAEDIINRFRYFRRDFVVLHCRAPPEEACFETRVFAANFNEPLTRWFCDRHREQLPDTQAIVLQSADSSGSEADPNLKVFWKPASLLTQVKLKAANIQPEAPSKHQSLKTSIWNDSDPNARTSRQRPRRKDDVPARTDKGDLPSKKADSDSSPGAQLTDTNSEILPNPGHVKVIDPYISIPVSILNRDVEGFIYVYSTVSNPGAEVGHLQYFKIGRPMDIKRQNSRNLQRCSAVRQIHYQIHQSEFRHLKRFKVSRPNLLMFYINKELMKNFFNPVTPPKDHCSWCDGSHKDWYCLTAKGVALLEKKFDISLTSSLPGWIYINMMILQLIDFIEKTDFS